MASDPQPAARRVAVAVVGAGLAGATCAQALAAAGCDVQVLDKARGPGGRLATRRLAWTGPNGQPRTARVDHGAPGFAAADAGFMTFLQGLGGGAAVTAWTPQAAPGSRPVRPAGAWQLPVPDMPTLCRGLLGALPARWSFTVQRLLREGGAWRIEGVSEAGPEVLEGGFDAVVLALPPAQAAPLLAPHRPDWAQHATQAPMQPRWTLMGVTGRPPQPMAWQVLRPQGGPLSWLQRDDLRPGRRAAADEAHWVAHARGAWSREHLEEPPEWVLPRLRAAVDEALGGLLGEPPAWRHAVVHRWRYALPQPAGTLARRQAWWDARRGLGACGDFLGGVGAEGAWLSARALLDAMTEQAPA
jgi:predicted NAD/FAD-dependent oxidoreductase